MRWLCAALLLALAWLPAAHAAAPPVTALSAEASPEMDARELGLAWLDASGRAGIEQVAQAGFASFQRPNADLIYSLGAEGALWLHYRLLRPRGERGGWLLTFPMPAIDNVTVFQQDAAGKWTGQSAGDTLAVNSWPEPGRYPHFRLDLTQGQVRDVYVRVRHFSSANFPVELISAAAFDQRVQLEYLGLGLTFGALVLLIAACLAQALVYRDRVYGWYAAYAFVTSLCVAAYTGVASHLLWPGFGALGDSVQPMLALVAGAAALLFVRDLTGIAARHHRFDTTVFWLGVGGIVAAVLFPLVPRGIGFIAVAAYVTLAAIVNMLIAGAAWRRGDVVGAWVLFAYVPLTAAVAMAMLRLLGVLPVSFGTQYAVVVAMAIEVPLLLVALNIRSRERHGAQIRELALSTQDALTGLLAPHLFNDRLRQVITRFRRDKENSAVLFIELVNYPRIKEHYGSAVAEQSLLRSVIKLRRLVRDIDTVSRIGEARFGLILEGVTSRIAVTDRAARLIAAGLMPLVGLKPDVTLQFHIASVLLAERCEDGSGLAAGLAGLLEGMSPRTRRPIRFLEPEITQPSPLEPDSALPGDTDSQLPENAPTVAAELGVSRTATRH